MSKVNYQSVRHIQIRKCVNKIIWKQFCKSVSTCKAISSSSTFTKSIVLVYILSHQIKHAVMQSACVQPLWSEEIQKLSTSTWINDIYIRLHMYLLYSFVLFMMWRASGFTHLGSWSSAWLRGKVSPVSRLRTVTNSRISWN